MTILSTNKTARSPLLNKKNKTTDKLDVGESINSFTDMLHCYIDICKVNEEDRDETRMGGIRVAIES